MTKVSYAVKDWIRAYSVHNKDCSLSTYFRRKYRWSKTLYKYTSKHPSNAAKQSAHLKPRRLWNSREKIIWVPQYFKGLILLKTLKLFIGLIGLLARDS